MSGTSGVLSGQNGAIDSRISSLSDYTQDTSEDLFSKAATFQAFLADLRQRNFQKYLLPVKRYEGGRAIVDNGGLDTDVLMFCSADYLDLGRREEVQEAARTAISRYGTSVSGVPLIAGATDVHKLLETELARFVGAESCVLFQTGQAANVGAITALCGARDFIVVDKQVHASILEGIRLARSRWCTFRHSDADHLDELLSSIRAKGQARGILVVLEGVYGLDGDVSTLPDLYAVAARYGARILLDDAHGTGVLGATGAGTAESFNLPAPDMLMGSLSKAFGGVGGWIAGPRAVIDYLRYFSGSLVFSVGLSASSAAAALSALKLIQSDKHLPHQLMSNAQRLQEGLSSLGHKNASISQSPIVTIRIDSEPLLRDVLRDLFEQGLWAEGLAFPATVRGEERIRLRARVSHTRDEIDQAVNIVGDVLARHGAIDRVVGVGTTDWSDASHELVDLALRTATKTATAPPWFTSNFYQKVIEGSGGWGNSIVDRRVFLSGPSNANAGLLAQVVRINIDGSEQLVGALGHCHSVGPVSDLASCLDGAIEWLGDRVGTIYGPLQAPLQVLGGGCIRAGSPSRPFLEPSAPAGLVSLLERRGFQRAHTNIYRLHELASQGRRTAPVPGVSFRPLRRERMESDFLEMGSVMNQSIAHLPLCSRLDAEALCAIVQEFRDFLQPDLWSVAECDGKVVGFAGGFPDLLEAFAVIGGAGDVSDIEFARRAADEATCGFVAWCGVSAEWTGRGVGPALIEEVLSSMRRREFAQTWLSWELVDGAGARFAIPDPAVGKLIHTAHLDVLSRHTH